MNLNWTSNILAALFFTCTFLCGNCKAQVISQFNWNSNPVTTAVVGPNATSAGGTATSSPGGVGGTNGLNPGAPTASDINLTIPNTGNVFDVPNVDISIDYRRNESTAQMVKRNTFAFNTGGSVANFRVTYRVTTGTVVTTVISSNVAIPSDATFRTYRFTYNNCSGVGTMYVNAAVVWTSTPTPNQDLYWVGDGNVVIGNAMDGANNNIPNLDNFIWQNFVCAYPLPISLTSFNGENEGRKNYLEWTTSSELNNNYFSVERSTDGLTWQEIQRVYSLGNSSAKRVYSMYDEAPENTVNYYQLSQTDFDGTVRKFTTVVIDNSPKAEKQILKITDLLGRPVNTDYEGPRIIFYSDGTVLKKMGR